MLLKEVIKKLQATSIAVSDENREIKGGYAGDFLSFVMGNAPENSAWFTVMSNVNVAGVAVLADVGVVVVCEGVQAEPPLIERCKQKDINLIQTPLDIYNAILSYNK